jgi:WD40 repeat protein
MESFFDRFLDNTKRRALLGHKGRCFDCSFRPGSNDESTFIATASEDMTTRIWKISQSEVKCVRMYREHTGEVLRVSWGPAGVCGGNLLVTGSADGTARLWDISGPVLRAGKPIVLDHGEQVRKSFVF